MDFEVDGPTCPFVPGDVVETGDEELRGGDVLWLERVGAGRVVIRRASSYPRPDGVPAYRMGRGKVAAVRLVQLDEPPKARSRPWWRFW